QDGEVAAGWEAAGARQTARVSKIGHSAPHSRKGDSRELRVPELATPPSHSNTGAARKMPGAGQLSSATAPRGETMGDVNQQLGQIRGRIDQALSAVEGDK